MSKTRLAVASLSLSAVGLAAITTYEGYRDTVYIPVPNDLPTAGYGHADIRFPVGKRITKDQALKWLAEDTKEAETAIKKCVRVPLTQSEFDSYVSFAYNIGGTAFCKSTLVKLLNQANYNAACQELKKWVYSGGQKIKGLEARRKMEYLTCSQGIYPKIK